MPDKFSTSFRLFGLHVVYQSFLGATITLRTSESPYDDDYSYGHMKRPPTPPDGKGRWDYLPFLKRKIQHTTPSLSSTGSDDISEDYIEQCRQLLDQFKHRLFVGSSGVFDNCFPRVDKSILRSIDNVLYAKGEDYAKHRYNINVFSKPKLSALSPERIANLYNDCTLWFMDGGFGDSQPPAQLLQARATTSAGFADYGGPALPLIAIFPSVDVSENQEQVYTSWANVVFTMTMWVEGMSKEVFIGSMLDCCKKVSSKESSVTF